MLPATCGSYIVLLVFLVAFITIAIYTDIIREIPAESIPFSHLTVLSRGLFDRGEWVNLVCLTAYRLIGRKWVGDLFFDVADPADMVR